MLENHDFAPQSLGFWVSEGFAPGLALAGLAPAPRDQGSDEVHEAKRCRAGMLLRWLSPSDIEDAP